MPRALRDKDLGKLARSGAIWHLVRRNVGHFLFLPTAMVLARLLSPEEFGLVAAASFFYKMANHLGTLGLNAALIRIKEVRPEHTSSVFALNLIIGVCSFALLRSVAPAVGNFYGRPETAKILVIVAFNFLITPFGSVPAALLQRHLRFRATAGVEWVSQAVSSVSAVAFAWLGFGFWSLVYSQLAANAAGTATKLYLSQWRPSLQISVSSLREIVPFGLGVFTKRLLDYGANNADSLVVGKLLGVVPLGLYDKAFNTMNRLLTRVAVAPGVSFRILSGIQDDPPRFRRAHKKIVVGVTLVGYPLFSGLIVVADPLFIVLFGQQWTLAVLPFQILCGAGMLKMLNRYLSSAVQAGGMIWSEVWRQLAYGTLLVSGIALFSRWGVTGAAAAVLGATITMNIMMWHLTARVVGYRVSELLSPQIPGIVCALCTATGAASAGYLMQLASPSTPPLLLLVLQSAAGLVAFVIFLLISPSQPVRSLVYDVINDRSPALARRLRASAT